MYLEPCLCEQEKDPNEIGNNLPSTELFNFEIANYLPKVGEDIVIESVCLFIHGSICTVQKVYIRSGSYYQTRWGLPVAMILLEDDLDDA